MSNSLIKLCKWFFLFWRLKLERLGQFSQQISLEDINKRDFLIYVWILNEINTHGFAQQCYFIVGHYFKIAWKNINARPNKSLDV